MLKHLFWANSLHSTNDLIRQYPSDSACIAAKQTAGRGRQGKVWLSEIGGLYLTYKKSISSFKQKKGLCAIAIGVACHRALSQEKKLYLKWPNDILNNHFKKIAGILIETQKNNYLIGIGLNCSTNKQFANYQSTHEILWLAKILIDEIDFIANQSSDDIIEYWQNHTQNQKGSFLKADLPNGSQIQGQVSYLSDNGELCIETSEGLFPLQSALVQNIRN